MHKILIFLSFLMVFNSSIYCADKHVKNLKINIISYRNGVGLSKDIDILKSELTKLGHTVAAVEHRDKKPLPKVDINVFIEVVDDFYFPMANKNYLIPNPEWYNSPLEWIPKFDKVLCKTKEGARVFKPLNKNTLYMGFTSVDKYDPAVAKDYKSYMHLAGASVQKGTVPLARQWAKKPFFPTLHVVKHQTGCAFAKGANINPVCSYLKDAELVYLQNSCGVHVCPSETEGFGHYIMEALSCESVVLTTNAPPMNEFISDPRCLISVKSVGKMRLANTYFFKEKGLTKSVKALMSLPDTELQAIGKRNRQFYLDNDKSFKKRLAEIFGDASKMSDSIADSQEENNPS